MARPTKLNPNSETFWTRLLKASEFADVPCTPGDIAKELDVWPGAVTKYIEGKFPSKGNINKLAVRRGVRSEWLLSGQGEMVAEEALDKETVEFLRLWRHLDVDAKSRMLISLRHEFHSSFEMTTGKRQLLTEEIIRLLEDRQRQ